MKPFWKIFLVIFVLAGGGFYWWTKQSGGKPGEAAPVAKSEGKTDGKAPGKRGGGPINVSAVKTARAPMPVIIDAVGAVESEHSVAVRPQVNGVLDAVLFREGDRVKQGQALFRLDARPMTRHLGVLVQHADKRGLRSWDFEPSTNSFNTSACDSDGHLESQNN